MNIYADELQKKWDSINYYDGGSKQLAIIHPLEWYVRYASQNHKCLVIVSNFPVDSISSSKSIDAACNRRKDGRYAITFTLINNDQEDVFITMASDIIEYSITEIEPKESLQRVLRRYSAWMKLLDHKNNALLGINSQKGLLAELFFLKEIIECGKKPSEALDGWTGPDGGDQDFIYTEGWYEIKATGASSTQISISSVEQLGNPSDGELVVFRIDKCAPSYPGAITLYKAVHYLFQMLSPDMNALDVFILKLGSVGYIDMDEYDKHYFSVSAKQSYYVNDSFPKIVRNNLPVEISNAVYQIDLPSIESWKK